MFKQVTKKGYIRGITRMYKESERGTKEREKVADKHRTREKF